MTPTRYQQVLQGLNGLSKQVLTLLPVEQPVPVQAVVSELTRMGKPREFRVVHGALKRLVDAGVALEPAPQMFRHVTVRGRTAPKRAVSVRNGVAVPASRPGELGDVAPVVAALQRPLTVTEQAMKEAFEELHARTAPPPRPEPEPELAPPEPQPQPELQAALRQLDRVELAPVAKRGKKRPPHPLDALAAVSKRLRAMSGELASLADDIDASVGAACKADLARLEELQAALRRLGRA